MYQLWYVFTRFQKRWVYQDFENSLTDKQITNNRVKGLQRPDMIKKNAGNGNGNSSSTGQQVIFQI